MAEDRAEEWAMREREMDIMEVNQTAANCTENKQSWEKHTQSFWQGLVWLVMEKELHSLDNPVCGKSFSMCDMYV